MRPVLIAALRSRQEIHSPLDIIIKLEDRGIVLIKRNNPPYGLAIPGGAENYFDIFLMVPLPATMPFSAQAILSRGYSITYKLLGRSIIKSSADVQEGDKVQLRLHEGVIGCIVEEIHP